jgi:hypothetical protein
MAVASFLKKLPLISIPFIELIRGESTRVVCYPYSQLPFRTLNAAQTAKTRVVEQPFNSCMNHLG